MLLPITQLHTGHYGQHLNTRYHALLSKKIFQGRSLCGMDEYMQEILKLKKKTLLRYCDEWENKHDGIKIEGEMKAAVAESHSSANTYYIEKLKKNYPYAAFQRDLSIYIWILFSGVVIYISVVIYSIL